jgi:DNA repair exonuclease SbcCD ATPase subunit
MSAAADLLQGQINEATKQKAVWDAELLKLNRDLLTAKFGKKNEIRKAIRNAEQQIKDYLRQIKKLNDDLASLLKAETKQQDNNIAAEQGRNPANEIIATIGGVVKDVAPVVSGSLQSQNKRSADVNTEVDTKKPNMMYIIIGAVVLLFLMMKKK